MLNLNAAPAPLTSQIAAPSLSRASRAATVAHLWLNRAVLGGIAVQFYTVGLAAMGVASFAAHAVLGWSMIAVAALSLVSAGVSRMPNSRLLLPAAVLLLTIAQPFLALVPQSAFPMIYALHGANAVILLALAFRTDRVAVRILRDRRS